MKCEPQLYLRWNLKSNLFLQFHQALKISEKKKDKTFLSVFLHFWVTGKQLSFWQSRDFVDWTQLCCSARPSALRWLGGDRSSPSPTATGQPPGPTGRAAHLWAKSSPVPYIIPWIQTAQALGWRGRGCKGCGFLCEVSSSSSATRFRSLLSKVRSQILEAATESGTRVATPAFHLFFGSSHPSQWGIQEIYSQCSTCSLEFHYFLSTTQFEICFYKFFTVYINFLFLNLFRCFSKYWSVLRKYFLSSDYM